MKVSVCMIARNEETTLPTALESVKGLADEVVIVDTGSEDRTVEVARSLGATVIEGGDRTHKAKERNHAADASTGDWIVILDCDERVADAAGFRAFLETTTTDGVYIREEFKAPDGRTTLSFPQMRAWRRGAYRYHYRAHELPMATRPCNEEYTGFVWEHRPPAGRTWKDEHLLHLLLLDYMECPGEARPMYYLGRQYLYMGAYKFAVEKLNEFISTSKPGWWGRSDAFGDLASAYQLMGDTEKAMDALMRAIGENPNRRDWWGRLAEMHHLAGHHEIAIGMLKTMLELPPHNEYVMMYWYSAYPYDLLARCLWYAGRHEEGYQYAKQAAELAPDDPRIISNLGFFERERAAPVAAVTMRCDT